MIVASDSACEIKVYSGLIMRTIIYAIILIFVSAFPATAEDLSKLSNEALIDQLVNIDAPAPGLSGGGIYDSFMALDGTTRFMGGLLGAVQPPAVPAEMKELTHRGAAALPELLAHLDDSRQTKLAIERSFLDVNFGEDWFSESPKRKPTFSTNAAIKDEMTDLSNRRNKEAQFHVKVGDVCYVLVGQIVGRNLAAARYQPSGILVINSPIFEPSLAEEVKAEWGGVTAEGLKASLLRDIDSESNPYALSTAFVRLKYYFPEAYGQLTGDRLEKRVAYEKATSKETGEKK